MADPVKGILQWKALSRTPNSALIRPMKFRRTLAATLAFCALKICAADRQLVFVGTYTGGQSKGIYSYELDTSNGTLRQIGLAAETPSPSFLAIHPNKQFLYAVNEVDNFGGKKAGSVTGFRIDPQSGKLTQINSATSGGSGPCHLTVDKNGKFVLLANYGGGSVEVLPINENGELGDPTAFIQHTGSSANQQRQGEPHAHSINLDAQNRFAVAADLGLDKLLIYQFDERGRLSPNDPPFASLAPGSGPRHFAFHPDGRHAYVINELSSTATAFAYNADRGTLTELQTLSTLPDGPVPGNSTAEIQVHPSGKFVYGSNRGHNSIVVFSVDKDGKLKHIENESTRGKIPRNFGIDPTGKYLIAANQESGSLAVFQINAQTGALDPIGDPINAPKPVCIKFLAK
jgi:6-phosphogluconolactonase